MHKTSILFVSALILLSGCQPEKNPAGLLPKADRAPHFDETAAFLELGGVFYGFMDITDQIADLGDTLTEIATAIKETTPGAPPLPLDFSRFFSASGLSGLQAIGMSSRQLEEDYFHNRTIFLLPEGVSGLFAVFGDTSHDFDAPGLAPAGSDLVVEMDYRPVVLRDTILEMAAALAGPFGSGALASQLSRGLPQLGGRTANQLIEAMGSRLMIILELTEDGKEISLSPDFSIPEMQIAVGVDGITDLLSSARQAIESQPGLTWSDTDTGFEITSEEPPPPPFDIFEPVVVANTGEDRVFLATTRDFLDRCLGSGEKLEDTEAFARATESLPEEGISFSFVSPEFFAPFREFLVAAMKEEPDPIPEELAEAIAGWSFPEIPRPLAAVTSVEPNGLFAASNAPNSHRTTVVSLAVQPVAILSAMAIPAFQKVRGNAQQKTVLINLRQIASAGQQYLLEEGATSVTYSELVGEYFPPIEPVAGEDYTGLVVKISGTLTVTLRNGETVEYSY